MAKFHINGNGEAGQCKAQAGGCPFGGESEHFTTAEAARDAFEARMSEGAHASTSKKADKPTYEPVRSDGSRAFTVTYTGTTFDDTLTTTVYAKTASEARKGLTEARPNLKVTEVKRKLAQTPEQKDAARRSSVDDIRSFELQRQIDEELANTEFGAQFKPDSLQTAVDGRTLTGIVEESFTYQGRRYEEGTKLRLSSDFGISHTISQYSEEPETLARRRLYQETPRVQQEINRVARNHGDDVADDVYSLMKDARTVGELRNRAGDLKLQSDKYGSEIFHQFNAARDAAEAKAKELEAKGFPWRDVMKSYTEVRPISELTSSVLRNRK